MKKIWLSILLLSSVRSAFSQGTVTFLNLVAFQTVDPTGGARLIYEVGSQVSLDTGSGLNGTNWVAELYAGPASSSLTPQTASIARFRAATAGNKGKWSTANLDGAPLSEFVLPGIDVNQTATLQVR